MDNQKREIWVKAKKVFVQIDYLRLNMIDDYNYVTRGDDVAYHLSLQYRVDHCICYRKRWW